MTSAAPTNDDQVLSLPEGLRLNLGCGPVQPPGWVNIDGSRRARVASSLPWLDRSLTRLGLLSPTDYCRDTRAFDLLKGLPYPDSTVACIYAGELWEHLEPDDAERLTRECIRVLRPGGVIRIRVPDGVDFWRRYIQEHDRQMERPVEERNASELIRIVKMYFRDIPTRPIILGSWGHTHKWQYDEIQLSTLLQRAGFCNVARRAYHDSRIPGIAAVEVRGYLIVEGVKPETIGEPVER